MSDLAPHGLAGIVPPASQANYASLLEGIRENGQREPIVLLDGLILDGRTRYRACTEAGVEPATREFGSRATDGADPLAYVIDTNRRRHMNPTQKAKAAALLVEQWGDLRKSSPYGDDSGEGSAQRRAAAIFSVGHTQVYRALTLKRRAPELFDQMDGETRERTIGAMYRRLEAQSGPAPAPQRAPAIPASERAAEQRKAVQLLVKANGAALAVNAEGVNVTAAIHAVKHRDDLVKLAMNVGWSVRYLARIERELRERLEPAELHRVDSAFEQPTKAKPGPLRVIRGEAS